MLFGTLAGKYVGISSFGGVEWFFSFISLGDFMFQIVGVPHSSWKGALFCDGWILHLL